MSLDFAPLLFALLHAAVLVVSALRAGPSMRGWVVSGVLLAAVTLAGGWLLPAHAEWIAGGAWLLLVGAPAGVRMAYVRALQRRDMRGAARGAHLMWLLHPSRSHRSELLRVRANVLQEEGREEEALVLLEEASRGESALSLRTRVERLTMQLRWPEVAALMRAEVGEAQLRADPGLLLLWMRALGECGERAELLALVRAHGARLEVRQAFLLRGMARLYLFAFTGQRARVERVLTTSLATLPAAHADYWRATVALVAGDTAAAHALLLPHLQDASAPVRRSVEERLARGLPPSSPVEGEEALLQAHAEALEQEVRYGPDLAAGGAHRARLTRAVALLLLLVHGAVWFTGGWDFDNPLLVGGGLWVPAILQGDEWWRLLTFQLLHFGHLHLVFNVMALWVLGREVERMLGARRMAVLLGVCGTLGGLLEVALHAAGVQAGRFTVGASGAILGLMGALLAFFLRGALRGQASLARRRLLEMGLLVVAQGVADVLIPQVSLLGHATGVVSGLLVGLMLAPSPAPEPQPAPAPSLG